MPRKKQATPKLEDIPETCTSCRFFLLIDPKDEVGFCRRNPKQWTIDADFVGWAYPEQNSDEWCGEHKPVEH